MPTFMLDTLRTKSFSDALSVQTHSQNTNLLQNRDLALCSECNWPVLPQTEICSGWLRRTPILIFAEVLLYPLYFEQVLTQSTCSNLAIIY